MSGQAALTALALADRTASTNTDLVTAVAEHPEQWPHMSALVADHQEAGKGRAGRQWHTPQGAALTVSVVLRSKLAMEHWGLIPLAAGLAVVRCLEQAGVTAQLKWPNDVVVAVEGPAVPGWGRLRKVAGILCEACEGAVVAGIGINVSQEPHELPVEHAASLLTLGAHNLDRVALLECLSAHLAQAVQELESNPVAFVTALERVMVTLGQEVVVERPGSTPLTGTAVALAPDGALVVRSAEGDHTVNAGDVRLRFAGSA